MVSAKLVIQIETHWEAIHSRFLRLMRSSQTLPAVQRLPESELQEACRRILRNLGHWLVSSSEAGTVLVADAATGTLLAADRGPASWRCLAVSPSDDSFAVGTKGSIQIHRGTQARIAAEGCADHDPRSLAFDARGTRLASGGSDRTVRVFDAATGRALHRRDDRRRRP